MLTSIPNLSTTTLFAPPTSNRSQGYWLPYGDLASDSSFTFVT
jgi:hypothetical protein